MESTWFVDGSVRDPDILSDFLITTFQGCQYTPFGIYSYPNPLCSRVAQTLAKRISLQTYEYETLTNFEGAEGAGLWECVQFCISNVPGVIILTSAAFQGVLQGYRENGKELPPGVFAIAQYPEDIYFLNISFLPLPSIPESAVSPTPSFPTSQSSNPSVPSLISAELQDVKPYLPPIESLAVVHAKLNASEIAQTVAEQSQLNLSQYVNQLETRLQSSVDCIKTTFDRKLQELNQAVPEQLSICANVCIQSLSANLVQAYSALPEQLAGVPTAISAEDDSTLQACRAKLEQLKEEVERRKKTYQQESKEAKVSAMPLCIIDIQFNQESSGLQLLVANFTPGTLKEVTVFGKLQGSIRQMTQVIGDIAPGANYTSVKDERIFHDGAAAELSLWRMTEHAGNFQLSEPYLLFFNKTEAAPFSPAQGPVPPM